MGKSPTPEETVSSVIQSANFDMLQSILEWQERLSLKMPDDRVKNILTYAVTIASEVEVNMFELATKYDQAVESDILLTVQLALQFLDCRTKSYAQSAQDLHGDMNPI